MEREKILEIVIRHLKRNVDGLEGATIEPSRSMVDYEASSLDIVEVVSASMRELGIRVPRTELIKLKNIDELVDLFHRVKTGLQTAPDAPGQAAHR